MRLLLVVNENAQQVTRRRVDLIARALATELDVEVEDTKRGGHATHLTQGAVHEGVDLVAACGGDGTVNEVANALAGTQVPLAIIPAGGTNVLARLLGIPNDPIDATVHLLDRLERPTRRVSLGRADGRHFTFTCGLGFDGAIVQAVERRQRLKKTGGQGYYVWSGVRSLLAYDRRRPRIRVRWGGDLEHVRPGQFIAISQNARPFTYLGGREMHLCPEADIEGGLDLLATERFRIPFVLRILLSTFGSARHVRRRHVLCLHDESRIEVESEIPLPVQMDGEYVGERTRLRLEAVPDALSIRD